MWFIVSFRADLIENYSISPRFFLKITLSGVVIDGRYVITGSFNWTTNAEKQNRENLVILDCPEMEQAYQSEWESIQRDEP